MVKRLITSGYDLLTTMVTKALTKALATIACSQCNASTMMALITSRNPHKQSGESTQVN